MVVHVFFVVGFFPFCSLVVQNFIVECLCCSNSDCWHPSHAARAMPASPRRSFANESVRSSLNSRLAAIASQTRWLCGEGWFFSVCVCVCSCGSRFAANQNGGGMAFLAFFWAERLHIRYLTLFTPNSPSVVPPGGSGLLGCCGVAFETCPILLLSSSFFFPVLLDAIVHSCGPLLLRFSTGFPRIWGRHGFVCRASLSTSP